MKIFKKKAKAQKVGKNPQNEAIFVKCTVGDFTSEHELKEVLIVGSAEHADIKLDNEGVSKVHCKIFNNNGIISIIDCSSSQGTVVNKKLINANKQYIVKLTDKVNVGLFHLSFETKLVQEQGEDLDLPQEEELQNNVMAEIDDFQENKEAAFEIPKQLDLSPKKIKKASNDSLNSFFRVTAIGIEVLLLLFVLDIVNFYFDLSETMNLMVSDLNEAVDNMINLSSILESQFNKIPALEKVYTDIGSLLPISFVQITKYLYLFILMRVIGTAILGMSVGQFLIGAKVFPRGVKAHLLGFLRSLLDLIFMPVFFITKFTTLFSRPSLEETLTGSLIQKRSFIVSFFLSVFFTLFILIAYLGLPLLYYPDSMITKSVQIAKQTKMIKEGKYQTNIDYLNLSLFSGEKTVILPRVSVKKNANASKIYPQLAIISEKSQIKLKKLKELRSKELFSSLYTEIVFLKYLYPEIATTFNHLENKSFKEKQIKTDLFGRETFKALKASFSIDPVNALEFIKENGPFLSPYVNFQRKIHSLVEIPFDEIKIFPRDTALFIFFQKKIRDKIYLNFFSIDEKNATLYDLVLEGISLENFVESLAILKNSNSQDDLTLFYSSFNSKDINLKTLSYHEIYELFFESTKQNIQNEYMRKQILLSANNIFDFFKNTNDVSSQAQIKLVQNLGDLIKAIENNNREFFNLKTNEVM